LIVAGLLAALASAGAVARQPAGSATPLPIRAARWVAPGGDMVRTLTEKPSECLAKAVTPEQAYAIEVGRAAFKTPLTLGGQASRAGIACENCHSGGRTNPQFFFPGVSGKPGTVDVTTSVFSSHRGDGIDNPKPIPDLSGPRERLKISRDAKSPELETFIHGLVTQEFDGAEPPKAVLAGLAAYVRGLSPAACPAQATQKVRMELLMDDAGRAVTAADGALARKDGPTALLMLASARTQLGLIYERYDAPGLDAERTALTQADLDLRAAQDAIRGGRDAATGLVLWQARLPALTAKLARRENHSLFDPVTLAASLR
jgi:hypothetical protein